MIEHIDRVPTKPNRYAVYDENHNFLRHEYHERADEPVKIGNPFNKALQDEFLAASGTTSGTASALTLAQHGFVLTDGATVRCILHIDTAPSFTLNVAGTGAKSVIYASGNSVGVGKQVKSGAVITLCYSIAKSAYVLQSGILDPYEVGDYIYTKRTDVPTNWVYLNGATYSVFDNSSLVHALVKNGRLKAASVSSGTSRGLYSAGLTYVNGYIMGGASADSTATGFVAYTQSPTTTPEINSVGDIRYFSGSTGSSSSDACPSSFCYSSVLGLYGCVTTGTFYLFSFPTFAVQTVLAKPSGTITGLVYHDGFFWITTTSGLFKSSDPRTVAWTSVFSGDCRSISVVDGTLYVVRWGYISSRYTLAWSANSGSTWTNSTTSNVSSLGNFGNFIVQKISGELYLVKGWREVFTSTASPKIVSLTDFATAIVYFKGYPIYDICENNKGYWIGYYSGGVYYSVLDKNFSATLDLTNESLWSDSVNGGTGNGTGTITAFPDDIRAWRQFSKTQHIPTGIKSFYTTVPAVTVTDAYAYMKYKEV